MGFLAFLVIGGACGACAWGFYPGRTRQNVSQKLLKAALIGFLASLGVSYLGQFTYFFQAGQMLEWLSAIVAASLAGGIYAALSNRLS